MGATAVAETEPETSARAGLKPFVAGDERTRELARKGGQTRAKRAAEAKERAEIEASAQAGDWAALQERFSRAELGDNAAVAVQWALHQAVTGAVKPKSLRDLADFGRFANEVYRLETGQATAHSLHIQMGAADALASLQNVREVTGEEAPGDQ